jgi:hypothetical protein
LICLCLLTIPSTRWCGRVFCDRCTMKRVPRLPGILLRHRDTQMAGYSISPPAPSYMAERHRVCDSCYTELYLSYVSSSSSAGAPDGHSHFAPLETGLTRAADPVLSDLQTTPRAHCKTSPSQQSFLTDTSCAQTDATDFLAECPVCGLRLDPRETDMSVADMEGHINECLSNGSARQVAGDRYIS